MKRKILALVLTILVLVTAVTGCGSGSGQDSKTDDSTVTVLGAIINETFDPFTTARMESWVKFALFDYLFRIDENGEVQPMLAESWEEGEDGLTITIHLRQDVKTHDGLAFNADDVIFSLDTLFASPTNYYLATYMASWEKVDEYTVKVIKGGAYCKTLEVLATNCPMVSMEAYQELGAESFAAAPVGTGPYTLVEQGGDNVVTLQAYQDYWNGVPAYETLEVRPPIDMSTAVISLQNGELDIVASVPAAQWSILEGDDSVVLDTTTGWASMTLCMVSSVTDVIRAKQLLAEVAKELADEGIPFRADFPVGVMVEVPSLALMASQIAKQADFASIGTNDLVQYLLAADRDNPDMAAYYQSFHPAVFQAIRMIIEGFSAQGKPVSVCGELGSDPRSVPILLGLGLRTLSISPARLGEIKYRIAGMTMAQMEQMAQDILAMGSQEEVIAYLEKQPHQAECKEQTAGRCDNV